MTWLATHEALHTVVGLAGGPTLDLSAIVGGTYFASNGHLFVLLHSWALAAAVLLAGWARRSASWGLAALALGFASAGNLLVDHVVSCASSESECSLILALIPARGGCREQHDQVIVRGSPS